MTIKLNRKYAAFTIMELIVVMFLTVITITFSFKAFEMFNKIFSNYRLHAFRMTELTTFQRALSRDIFKAEAIVKMNDGLRCSFGVDSVEYHWQDNYVLRNSVKTDTFHFEIIETEYLYEQQEQFLDLAPVDVCRLHFKSDQDSITLYFTKQYSVEQKLRYREKYGYQENTVW